jgi:hypothetical protein
LTPADLAAAPDRRLVRDRDYGPRERYDSLARFYNADQRRARSRELDVGLWWREGRDGALHRAAWVADTGELYLVRLGDPADGGGEVELLAHGASRELLERALDGWREQCGAPRSLAWLRRMAALLRRSVPGGGSTPPAARAPARSAARGAIGCTRA